MNNKNPSRMRNKDQFTFIVKPAPTPTEEELAPYRESTDEPHPSMHNLMKGKVVFAEKMNQRRLF